MRQFKLLIYCYLEIFLNLFPDFYIGNKIRRCFYKYYFFEVGKGLIVNVNCHFEVPSGITIGENCSFNRSCWVSGGGSLKIGNDVIFGPKVIIHTANHNYFDQTKPIRLQGHSFKEVIINNNVWVGAGAIILPGVTINSNSIIAAGAVVSKDVPSNVIAGGVPARVIKEIKYE